MINVFQEQIQRRNPLRETVLDFPPFRVRNDPRQQVIGKHPLGALFVAVDRERNPLMQE